MLPTVRTLVLLVGIIALALGFGDLLGLWELD
jgi:hypothetical protein